MDVLFRGHPDDCQFHSSFRKSSFSSRPGSTAFCAFSAHNNLPPVAFAAGGIFIQRKSTTNEVSTVSHDNRSVGVSNGSRPESIVHCFASVLPSRTIPAQCPSSIISPFAKIKIDFQRHPAAFAESRFFHDLADNSITAWSHAPVASCDFTDGHSTGKLERSRCISFPISAFYGGVGWHIFQKPAPFPETGTESAAFENFAIHNAVFGD